MREMAAPYTKRLEASPIRTILDRAAALRSEGRTVIPFSAGEPDFPTPSTIKKATQKAIEDDFSHYTSNRGLPQLRELLARKLKKEASVLYDPNIEILVTSSGAEALNNAILTFVGPGDEVIIPTPAFVSYKNLVKFAGGEFIDVPLLPEDGFQLNAAKIEAAITGRTKMIIINNPNNPSGAVYTREALEQIADLAIQYDLLVLSDEMYSRLVYEDAQFVSMASLPGMKERTITVSGFSKTYAMTGWRIGFIAADKALTDWLIKCHQYSTTCSPTFIQKGIIDALDDPQTEREVQKMLDAFAVRRTTMIERLQAIKQLKIILPKGAFYILVDVSGTGMDGMAFAMHLLENYGVATVPAIGLGDSCKDYIRISYAASDHDIAKGLTLISQCVEELSANI